MKKRLFFMVALAIAGAVLFSLQLRSQTPVEVRPVPPPGVKVSDADSQQLNADLKRLSASLESIRTLPLESDVRVFRDAVSFALNYNEFFKPEEVSRAKELLRAGQARADQLRNGRADWDDATGLIVRGYISRIDRSVQPYGLVVPASYDPKLPRKWRLDAWFHGRNETLSEVNFLWDRMHNSGEFTPRDTLVL